MIGSALTASAAVDERTFSFDVSAQGDYADPHEITVETGDIITVAYKLTVDGEDGLSVITQNEIFYDTSFFRFVEGSIQTTNYMKGVSTGNHTRVDGNGYIYFNNASPKTVGANSEEATVGTFQLKVIAKSGTSVVKSTEYGAVSLNNVSCSSQSVNLMVILEGSQRVPVSGVQIPQKLSMEACSFQKLPCTFNPENASIRDIIWASSDTNIAAVDKDGTVTAIAEGTTTITATTVDGGKTASCTVTVTANAEETTPETPAEIPQTPAEETPVEETVPETPGIAFTDVKKSNYFYDAVLWAVENEITLGKTATLFDPSGSITRAQAVTFLWRAAGCPVVNDAMRFTDVKAGAYYAEAVRWAVAEGITNGTTSSTFSPNATCTRGQIVSFLYRYAKASPVGTGNPFTDVAAGAYYYDAVLWAVSKGITGGTTASTFAPKNTCSRAQVVTFLYRYMGK